MLDTIKTRLGVLYPIIATLFVSLSILMIFRLGLSCWQFERVNNAHGWLPVIFSGLRIDIASLSFLLVIPGLLSCFLTTKGAIGKSWLFILRIWIVLILWFLVYMELATVPFIQEYDTRPNRLFIEYLIYPREVFGMLWEGYKLELLIGLLGTLVTVYGGWKFSARVSRDLSYPRWYWRPLIALVLLFVAVLGARSTLGHRALNPAMVAFSSDPLVNDLVLNSAYSMLFAASQMGAEDSAFKYYGRMDEKDIISEVRASTPLPASAYNSNTLPTLAKHTASYQGKPRNLVILLQESLGARYVGALGGLPLTPNLDALMQEGWNFNRLYATGVRSVRGIEAVVAGFSPTPGRAVVKLGKSQSHFFTLASLLKERGYHTQFIYGGESHFDNMKSFFLGNGFVDMQDFPTFSNLKFVGSWGASDEDLYNKAHQQFSMLNKQGKPFFSLVFTSSNHSPFDYPDGRITPYNQPKQTRENAAKYSDYALGEFFKQAKASDYWDNTVFIVIADHDSRAFGSQLVPVDHFHIPAVIIGKDIPHREDNRLASQIDMPPTLLSLIGISSENPMIGLDLTQDVEEKYLRAMMQFYKNFAWMDNSNNLVILQPEKPARGFHYNEETTELTEKEQPQTMIRRARANALWGTLAYKKSWYRLGSDSEDAPTSPPWAP